MVGLIFVCWTSSVSAFSEQSGMGIVDVPTTSGVVRGKTVIVKSLNTAVNQWLSIPYALPPVGNLRFAKPVPIVRPLEGVIDGTRYNHACMQTLPLSASILDMDEDCLFLNVWAPLPDREKRLKPVMFWIHGGGFVWGSAFEGQYDGAALASHDVLVVTINYRLGQFGFLFGGEESAPGNAGLYDQLLALKWVRENIHSFGGDKDQITIAGESAGSWSVSLWLTSPLASGLFKRGIMGSGAYMFHRGRGLRSADELLVSAKMLAAKFWCTGQGWLQCLKGVSALPLQLASTGISQPLNAFVLIGTDIMPYNEVQALQMGQFNKDLDLLAGVMKNEGLTAALVGPSSLLMLTRYQFSNQVEKMNAYFHGLNTRAIVDYYLDGVSTWNPLALQEAYWDFVGDLFILCPTYRFARTYAQQSMQKNVYFYEWTYAGYNLPGLNIRVLPNTAVHTADLSYVFGVSIETADAIDFEFSKYIMMLWTNFVKFGKPNNVWPKLISNPMVNVIQELNPLNATNVLQNRFVKNCDQFWGNYYAA